MGSGLREQKKDAVSQESTEDMIGSGCDARMMPVM
jgi:hypothetical protein